MNQEGVIFQQPGQKHLQSVARFTVCVGLSGWHIYEEHCVRVSVWLLSPPLRNAVRLE